MPPSRMLPESSANSWPSPRQFTGSRWLDPGIISSCARMFPSASNSVTIPGLRQKFAIRICSPATSGTVLADALRLRVAEAIVLDELAVSLEDEEPFVAAVDIHAHAGRRTAGEVADRQRVRVVPILRVVAPSRLPVGAPERVADQELLPPVAIDVDRVRIVPGLAGSLPQQREVLDRRPRTRGSDPSAGFRSRVLHRRDRRRASNRRCSVRRDAP